MKKWNYSGVLTTTFLLALSVLGCYLILIKYPIDRSYVTSDPPTLANQENTSQIIPDEYIFSKYFAQRNFSNEEQSTLESWSRLTKNMTMEQAQDLPNGTESIKIGVVEWKKLMNSVEQEKIESKERKCPQFLSKTNASQLNEKGFKLRVPCGLSQGSSITFIGIPNGDFRIELSGEPLVGELDRPIILRYNVKLHGDNIGEDSVIVQNTRTGANIWGEEERCPSPNGEKNKKGCNELLMIKNNNQTINGSTKNYEEKSRNNFPFKQNELFVATLKVGLEGLHMTVDGEQITSFAFRETLEPWLVSEVSISGDVNLNSITATKLRKIEDLEDLKAVPLSPQKEMNLFIGVFSSPNNFKNRMAIRRSWMHYTEIRSGQVVVRFFVGLHKDQRVNKEAWNEARTYKDIQLMPFIDSYNLITWKTIATCIYGTEVVSAKFIMKTDDDSFVRVDEILNSLGRINVTRGLLYGLIFSDLPPHRETDSKWYITPEEYPDEKYPPWASGPGYVVSRDIAVSVSEKHKIGSLKMFKLEDVAMGIWVRDMKNNGLEVRYEKDDRIYYEGCKGGYVVAHQQGPGDMLCLWKMIREKKNATCCGH